MKTAMTLSVLAVLGATATGCGGKAGKPDAGAAGGPTQATQTTGATQAAVPDVGGIGDVGDAGNATVGAEDGHAPSDDATASEVVSAEDFRSVRPTPRAMAAVKTPTVERFTLANGLEVFLVPATALPTVSMSFDFDVGTVDDPADKIGLASVCFDLFSEGTERLDKIAWSEALADHAVGISSPAGTETSSINVSALANELGPALDLLAELLAAPGMRKADFDRIIADRKAALAQSRATANGVAGRIFGALVWGKDHPYGSILVDKHLAAITLADCKAWVGQLKPEGARLWVAGKVTRASLTEALEARLARWTGKAPAARALAPAPAPSGAIYAVQIDGAVQSMVLVGHPGPTRLAEDYEATYLMAMIFGGSFSSRLNMNLREAHGYAYGCRGGFSYRRGGSHWSVSASVETSTTALALREIANETKTMRTTMPTADELGRERDGALLALPARFATAGDRLESLRSLAFFGLPLDWYDGYQTRLGAVEGAAVEKAAGAHLVSGDGVVLVVGDLTKPAKDAGGASVMEALKALADEKVFGAGGLVVLDVDGQPRL